MQMVCHAKIKEKTQMLVLGGTKVFELSKFQIFVNKRLKTTLNAVINHLN